MSMVMGAMMLETKVVMIVLMLTAATIKLAVLLYCLETCIFVQHKRKEIGWLKPSSTFLRSKQFVGYQHTCIF